jgi:hypothetical protein
MPMSDIKKHGTNADGTPNADYCRHCYSGGKFIHDLTVEEAVERYVPFLLHEMSEDAARRKLSKQLPTLKRWKTEQ